MPTPAIVLLEISKLTPPVPEGDVSLLTVLAFAALNPAVIAIAYWMGRHADQWPKLLIAAFVGALGGTALLWVAALLRIGFVAAPARAAAGIFVASLVLALGWAALGYVTRQRAPAP